MNIQLSFCLSLILLFNLSQIYKEQTLFYFQIQSDLEKHLHIFDKSMAHIKENQFERALVEYKSGLGIATNEKLKIMYLTNIGLTYSLMNNKFEAITYLNKIILRDPGNLHAINAFKVICHSVAPNSFIPKLKALSLQDPKNYILNFCLGVLFARAGNIILAKDYYQVASKNRPESFDALSQLALSYGILNKHHKAVEIFRRLLLLDPFMIETNLNLAAGYSILDNKEKCIFHLKLSQILLKKDRDSKYFRRFQELKNMTSAKYYLRDPIFDINS